jgi:hypothetical protein
MRNFISSSNKYGQNTFIDIMLEVNSGNIGSKKEWF